MKMKQKIHPLQRRYEALQTNCRGMRDHIRELQEDLEQAQNELHYLRGFISYKKLEEEYLHFAANAHEEYNEDMPFPELTL